MMRLNEVRRNEIAVEPPEGFEIVAVSASIGPAPATGKARGKARPSASGARGRNDGRERGP